MGQRFTRLKGISDERRLPRIGKIRLGIKKKSQKSGREYPAEVDYFVIDEPRHLKRLGYADRPTELKKLRVWLPGEEVERVMPVALKYYKASGLYCTGNGEEALRRGDDGALQTVECPCPFLEQNKCRRMAVINVVVPEINVGGVFQIVTGSWNSIVDFQSGMDYVKALIGYCSGFDLALERVPTEITRVDPKTKKMSKQTHYTLRLYLDADIRDIHLLNELKQNRDMFIARVKGALPSSDVNPVLDAVDVVVHDAADEPRAAIGHVVEPTADDAATGPRPSDASPPADTSAAASARAPKSAADANANAKTLNGVPGLWKKIGKIFGDRREAFWKALVVGYYGASNSKEVSFERAEAMIVKIENIALVKDVDDRTAAGNNLWNEMSAEGESTA